MTVNLKGHDTMAETAHSGHPGQASGREIGASVAAVGGLVFVWINSSGLAPAVRVPLLVLACAAVVAIVALIVRNLRAGRLSPAPRTSHTSKPVFGRGYWTITLVEAVALIGGVHLLSAFGHPELGIAWVAFVVGTHFFALGRLFQLNRFHLLAVLITVCGIAGFAVAGLGSPVVIAVVSGVLPGFILLGFALWAVAPRPR